LRPKSRGSVEIKSTDPLIYLDICPGYLANEHDYQVAIDGIKVARRIADAPAMKTHIIEEHVLGRQFESNEQLLETSRRFSQTI
jgi:choline dehydrogenase